MKSRITLFAALSLSSLVASAAYAQSADVKIRLVDRLDTASAQVGQTFSGTLEEPVRLTKKDVLPKGTLVKGTITDVVSSGRLKRPASITLRLNQPASVAQELEPLHIDGKSHATRNTGLIGGGALAGALLGGIAGGGKGALIGTAVGAGAGTGTAYATGKEEIVLKPETELIFDVAGANPAPAAASYRNAPPSQTDPQQGWQGDAQPGYPQDAQDQPQREEEVAYNEPPPPPAGDAAVSVGIVIGPPPPPRVAYVRPAAPGTDFVWITGYWYPVGHHYVWHDGYWSRPPREGFIWVGPRHDGRQFFAGHWVQDPHYVKHHDPDRDIHEHHDNGNGHDH
jgi:hypothetical protein